MKLLLASSLAAACVVAAAALPPRHTPELANPALEYDAEHDTICHRDTHVCYPRVFQATSESREIHDGQEVPGGLHIQLDMTNGRRMARLLRPDERHGAGTRDAAVHAAADTAAVHGGADTAADAEHGSGAVTVVRNQGVPGGSKALPKIVATRRSRSRAAEAPASAPPPDLTHFEGILAYLDALAQSGGRPSAHADDIATIHGALAELENYVHSVKHGVDLVGRRDAWAALSGMIQPAWPLHIRPQAALVIGSALQNNAAAQNAALASERSTLLLRHTVEQLLQEPSVAVRARLLYLLGAFSRGNDKVLASLHASNVLPQLSSVFDRIVAGGAALHSGGRGAGMCTADLTSLGKLATYAQDYFDSPAVASAERYDLRLGDGTSVDARDIAHALHGTDAESAPAFVYVAGVELGASARQQTHDAPEQAVAAAGREHARAVGQWCQSLARAIPAAGHFNPRAADRECAREVESANAQVLQAYAALHGRYPSSCEPTATLQTWLNVEERLVQAHHDSASASSGDISDEYQAALARLNALF